jgi:hypothetical protein
VGTSEERPVDERPVVLTALLADDVQEWFDALRRRHFPPDRNHLAAHLTLFHALPGAQHDALARRVAAATDRPAPLARVTGPRLLGRGVALVLDCPALAEVRAELAREWSDHLTRQDAGKADLHVTVQNKVDPAVARALHADLSAGFVPFDAQVTGLALWRYDGGPWDPGPRSAFRGPAGSAPEGAVNRY